MKKNLIALTILTLFLFLSHSVFAQEKQNYIPEKGYWQLVSNLKDKKTVTVRFYNDQNEMIYEETLSNTKMNPDRKKVRRQLYYALQDAYGQWAVAQKITGNNLIAKRK
jgi:hypothetical protein